MLTRVNWWVVVIILVIANYWSSLTWVGNGTALSPATLAIGLNILLATGLSVLGYYEDLFITKRSFGIFALLGLLTVIGLGLLIAVNSRMDFVYLLPAGYILVLVLTPLLLSNNLFWVVMFVGMFGMAYAYPPEDTTGYAVHYLISGLIIAAVRTGDFTQSLKVQELPQGQETGIILPRWQKILWPVIFASFLVGSVAIVHSILPVPGENLREMLVTQVRSWFRLNSEPTYQVIQNMEAGGTINPSGVLFMRVDSPYPDYWRGQSFDVYSGVGWQKKLEQTAMLREEHNLFDNPEIKTESVVVQQFTLAKGVTSNIAFSGYLPKALAVGNQEFTLISQGDMITPQIMSTGETYQVLVEKPNLTEDRLRKADSKLNWPETYLELPENLPERVNVITRKIVRGQSNTYDQAKAVEAYLRANFPYTLKLEKTPAGRDMVDYFLFTAQKGYCTYHASAMAVMLRTIGIPTRLVIGFTPGEWQEREKVYEVRDRNAHAWVEVYFTEIGWVPFEPTSSFRLPSEAANTADLKPEISPPRYFSGLPAGAGWGVAALLSCLVFSVVILIGLRIQKASTQENITPMTVIYRELLALLASKGHPKEASITPLEYIKGIRADLGENYPLAEGIVMAYLTEMYGGKQLSAELIAQLRTGLKKISFTTR